MSLGSRLCLLLSALSLVVVASPPVPASAASTSTVRLSAPAAYAGRVTTLSVTLTDGTGAPVAGATVAIERRTDGVWRQVGTVTTASDGRAAVGQKVSRTPLDNAVRATYLDDPEAPPASATVTLPIRRQATRLTIGGPGKVVDERSVVLRFGWLTAAGAPVAGAVRVYARLGGGPWRSQRVVHTNANGRATLRVTPRRDSRWRAVAASLPWVLGDRSPVHRIDNRPPGRPARLPAAAPRPRRKLPAQSYAVGAGAHLTVTTIDDRTWSRMSGVTWHSGCPVGRAQLRVIRVNYWDYHGYRRRGELVANADAARAMGSALAEMYRRKLPIRAMYRVDRFGWSRRSRGGDDYASMAAGNTSAFNCRDVTGRPGRRSPHAWGRSLDLNTWENPYRSAQGLVPNRWWQSHTHPRVAWRSRSHVVVRLMARHGLRWTYGLGDTQHFDYVGSQRRAAVAPSPCRRYCD